MNTKVVALAALAAIGLGSLEIGDAEARHRSQWRQWFFDPDFGFYRPHRGYYDDYEYDEDYDYDPPPRRRRQAYVPDDYEPDYVPRPRKRRPAVKLEQPPPAKRAVKPVKVAKPKPALMSCTKAAGIVTGYGFEAVKATNCKGDVYAFSAKRDGKSFAVTLNAKNGALTKVKKL